MVQTTAKGYPYPETSDSPHGPDQLQNLAARADELTHTARMTTTERDALAAPDLYDGRIVTIVDTNGVWQRAEIYHADDPADPDAGGTWHSFVNLNGDTMTGALEVDDPDSGIGFILYDANGSQFRIDSPGVGHGRVNMRAPDDSEAVARLDLINSDHVDGVAARLISSGVIVLNAIALETNADRLVFTQSAGDEARIHLLNPGESTERLEVRGNPNNGGLFRVFTNGGARDGEFRVRDGAGGHHTLLYMNQGATPELEVKGDFTVSGSKNAEIPDPVDATKAYRFAAIEADEPGLLFHRLTVTVPPGAAEETIALPAHWERIATDGDAMVTALDSTRDQAPAAAAVDLSVPEVTVRGKPGDYRVWVLAVRADPAISGWAHEVANTEE